ncbi:hypothetical protein JX265_000681 [Neoarthrinium moseri]|uniref:Uncharacterized protein n=1 Tax=Neoarthrinium moseri TaxID=1658444 RepID=A0A9P9WYZ1_9PEZI|nr:hypothetical protein JX265_000681 [Neoarthrinium moseri]
MFGGSRRHSRQQPHPQLTRITANPNASTAAAAAFMASSSQNPNRALSSAAAAAALRARPTTPTNVADVQTKRTMRRSPSVSSAGSGARTPRLERKASSGSMSERSFRSPSPHGERRAMSGDHPPVPAIPAGHRATKSSSSAGVGMQNFKTASQKMDTGLPSWYTKPSGDPTNVRTSDAPMNYTAQPQRPESITSNHQRSDSRSSSVNFSYPGRLRAQSPPASPVADSHARWSSPPRQASSKSKRLSTTSSTSDKASQSLVYDPNSRRMVPKADLEAVEYQVRAASEKNPKKKKSQVGVQRSGSQLAKGTIARVRGTMVEADGQQRELAKREQPVLESQHPTTAERQALEDPAIGTLITAPQPQQEKREAEQQRLRSPEPQDSRLSTPSPAPQESERITSPRPGRQLARKPSVVREEAEDDVEDVDDVPLPPKAVLDALDNIPTRQTLYEGEEISLKPKPQPAHPGAAVEDLPTEGQAFAENKTVAGLAREGSLPRRSMSQSPVRQARFAALPAEGLVVRHAPPPRSASPIKSALKQHSPSPRETSPAENGTADAARASAATPDLEAPLPRKKAVRVSFDDRSPIVVGESTPAVDEVDSPVVPSPQQTRRPWYSHIGRGKKKETALEDDEVMKPRPALPSFGSVREKKIREVEEPERPLIRPHESSASPPSPASPVVRPYSPSESTKAEPGSSNDVAIGSVLAQEQVLRNEANISRFREPLPPVVTSVEGHGDFSDSMRSTDDEEGLFDDADLASDAEAIPDSQTTAATVQGSQSNSQNGSTILEKIPVEPEQQAVPQIPAQLQTEAVPAIAITQPSPAIPEESLAKEKQRPYFDVPGMFPEDDSSDNSPNASQQTAAATSFPSSTADAMKEPEAVVAPSQARTLPQTTLATTPQLPLPEEKSDNESNDSIYSDAYEDLSDLDGDGFQSLNAVVESPVTKVSPPRQLADTAAGEKARTEEMKPSVQQEPADSVPLVAFSKTGGDWEQAKSFWRSLTAEKRRQLEKEALEDAGADGDEEEMQTPVRRMSSRSKKTAEQRQSTSVAQAAKAQAAAPAPTSKAVQPIDPERIYMIQPGSQATHGPISPKSPTGRMRTSLRGEQPARTGTLTKTTPGEVHMRRSMRSNAGNEEHASRRVSAPPERVMSPPMSSGRPKSGSKSQASYSSNTASNDVAASAASAFSRTSRPAPQRRDSDASDSSFKRARTAPTNGFGFRRTMRQDTAPAQTASPEATKGSSRFSLRSLSPSGSPFRRASTTAASSGPPASMSMRRTLRSGSDSSKEYKPSSVHFPSFGRSSGQKAAPRVSRLGDSSDEDEPVPTFRSRFDNSSDEEDARPSTASRPLSKGTLRGSATAPAVYKKATTPVPEEDEESPDLPDSDDDPSMHMPSPLQSPASRATAFRPPITERLSSGIGTSTLKRSGSGRGSLQTSATAPVITTPPKERRGSFMGNILRRNKKVDGAGKITRSEIMDSAARRDTKYERSTDELKGIRRDQRPTSPKLQKRGGINRGDSWPLPEATENPDRPSTAGGRVNGAEVVRPPFAGRRSVSLGLPGVETQVNGVDVGSVGQFDPSVGAAGADVTKKKKKFGTLRRMFRLDD